MTPEARHDRLWLAGDVTAEFLGIPSSPPEPPDREKVSTKS
jgi:hypothetical protein